MDFSDVERRFLRKNAILFTRTSPSLEDLFMLIRTQDHKTLVLWAFRSIEESLFLLKQNYKEDNRPEEAVNLCKLWSKGIVKMPIAKRALLQCHAMARDITNQRDIALCHAIGQACAVVHVETHAMGFVFYELSSIVFEYGFLKSINVLEQKINFYIKTLKSCEKDILKINDWAPFLMLNRLNKEQLLYEKNVLK